MEKTGRKFKCNSSGFLRFAKDKIYEEAYSKDQQKFTARVCLINDGGEMCPLDEISSSQFTCVTEAPKEDVVNNPAHYTDGKIEVIDFIEDKRLGFHLGNTVKYVSRAGKKDPRKEIQDLEKAQWYLNRRIEQLKAQE